MLKQLILDALYPRKCGLCNQLGPDPICHVCFSEFEPHFAGVLRGEQPLDSFACVFDYTGKAAKAVQLLKYRRVTSMASTMAELMADAAERRAMLGVDAVVPVPVHWSRRSVRGFNQAELLCERFNRFLVRPSLLKRTVPTLPQAGLKGSARLDNLANAFEAEPEVDGMSILLIDDVYTSGETARECARALKARGAQHVSILTFAGEPTGKQ